MILHNCILQIRTEDRDFIFETGECKTVVGNYLRKLEKKKIEKEEKRAGVNLSEDHISNFSKEKKNERDRERKRERERERERGEENERKREREREREI